MGTELQFGKVIKVLEMDGGDCCTQCKRIRCHRTVYLKIVNGHLGGSVSQVTEY